jgi:hypothetical protein
MRQVPRLRSCSSLPLLVVVVAVVVAAADVLFVRSLPSPLPVPLAALSLLAVVLVASLALSTRVNLPPSSTLKLNLRPPRSCLLFSVGCFVRVRFCHRHAAEVQGQEAQLGAVQQQSGSERSHGYVLLARVATFVFSSLAPVRRSLPRR